MDRSELRARGRRLLEEVRALRAVFPDAGAMRELPVDEAQPGPFGDEGATACAAALGYLRDEMLLVRAGGTNTLAVLDDEIVHAESLLTNL
jgi:hypothetical protein